jgi:hypothetical protein
MLGFTRNNHPFYAAARTSSRIAISITRNSSTMPAIGQFAKHPIHQLLVGSALFRFDSVPAQVSGDFAELFEGGFEVFDPRRGPRPVAVGPGSGSSRAKRVEGRRLVGRERQDRGDCRTLQGFRLCATRYPGSPCNGCSPIQIENSTYPFFLPFRVTAASPSIRVSLRNGNVKL